ncbi:hypothetical protein E2C01_051681 [Portunus trituberculatus]|uniref:Uncharacterized protein n=1 Tax=Portunus trituberculatus TaxID=210409 RepID=A0A5B7GMF2_PORTR|nr:hypothetical protein [Portunus trituberculatus]
MKTTVEDSKRCNIPVVRNRLKTVSKRRSVVQWKHVHFGGRESPSICVRILTTVRIVFHTWTDKALVKSYQLMG